MDIKELIEELENELYEAKGVLFSNKAKVDVARCSEIISLIKRNLPTAIQEASYLISQKEKFVKQSEETAKNIIAEAKSQADRLVSESEIKKRSEKEAKEMVEQATAKCKELYENAKENIDKMLKNIEEYMMDNLHIVRNNREELSGMLIVKKDKNNN